MRISIPFDPDECWAVSPGRPPPAFLGVEPETSEERDDWRTKEGAMHAYPMWDVEAHRFAEDGPREKSWNRAATNRLSWSQLFTSKLSKHWLCGLDIPS